MPRSFEYQGIAYTSWWNGDFSKLGSKEALDDIRGVGANSVSITSTYFLEHSRGSQIVADPEHTESFEHMAVAIRDAQARGLTVMLKPHLDSYDHVWRGSFQPSNVPEFFQNYKAFIVEQAEFAQAMGVELFSLGCEMDQLSTDAYKSYWLDIIDAVRKVYHGELTYSAHWFDPKQVSFLGELDVIGINPYVPLGDVGDTVEDFVAAWDAPQVGTHAATTYGGLTPYEYYASIAQTFGKKVIFTELGYVSTDIGARHPGYDDWSGTPNDALQADLYQAFFEFWSVGKGAEADWLAGTFMWNWDPTTDSTKIDRWEVALTPQNKPAEDVIARWYRADDVAAEGQEVSVTVRASGMSYRIDPELTVVVNGEILGTQAVTADLFTHDWAYRGQWQTLTFTGEVATTDELIVEVYYANDSEGEGERNLFVDWVEADGTRRQAEDVDNPASLGWDEAHMAPMVVDGRLVFEPIATRHAVPEDVTPPGVTINASSAHSNEAERLIAGHTEAGAVVEIVAAGVVLGHATADERGDFAITVTLPDQGEHVLTARVTDAAGNVGRSAPAVLKLDQTAPEIALSPLDGVVTTADVVVAGTVDGVEAGATVTLLSEGSVIGAALVGADGGFSSQVALDDGTHALSVRATDEAGNTEEQRLSVTVDTTAPALSAFKAVAAADGALELSGELAIVEPGLTLTVVVTDGEGRTLHEGPLTPTGTSFATVLSHISLTKGADRLTVTVAAADAHGNASTATLAVTAEDHGLGREVRIVTDDTVTRQFFDARGTYAGSEVAFQEGGELYKVFYDEGWTVHHHEVVGLAGDQLVRRHYDADWALIGAETVELKDGQIIRHLFDEDWERTGAEIVSAIGDETLRQTYDPAWSNVGNAIEHVAFGQLTTSYFADDWDFLGATRQSAKRHAVVETKVYDERWSFVGAERSLREDMVAAFDEGWQRTDEAPRSPGADLQALDPTFALRGDDPYEAMSQSAADLAALTSSATGTTTHDLLELYAEALDASWLG